MKERLTPKGGFAKIENMSLIKGYVINGIEVTDMLNRLAEYEDLEEQGLIKRFPCKVGAIIYNICKEDWTAEYTMVASRVIGFSDYGDGLGLRFVLPFGSPAVSLIGDRIFFTRPEAEKKLAKLKGEEK